MNKVLGFERINERRQRPNKLINFIKPLEGPDKELAQDFLERVAAICYPVMKANGVLVMSLEEYPPNKEFWGRNFNGGEIIQLVLKAPNTGQWLPFRHVQMVMMHELAHCKQMNHSRDFWKVNNAFRDELKILWEKKYTGDGLWGRGQTLLSGQYSTDHMPEAAGSPENLCGGTYRSRGGRKRKRTDTDTPKPTYAERKQRRIAKKFGVNGQALGADDYARIELDQGRHRPSKPRVANSKRGKELRLAAALARFDKVKEVTPKQEPVDSSGDDYETDSDDEEKPVLGDWDDNDNVVKVCEDENLEDGNAQRELDELRQIDHLASSTSASKGVKNGVQSQQQSRKQPAPVIAGLDNEAAPAELDSQISTASEDEGVGIGTSGRATDKTEHSQVHAVASIKSLNASGQGPQNSDARDTIDLTSTPKKPLSATAPGPVPAPGPRANPPATTNHASKSETPIPAPSAPSKRATKSTSPAPQPQPNLATTTTTACQACDYANEPGTASCIVCSHVINTSKIRNSWQCRSDACRESVYRNLGDYGRCYVCGASRLDPDRVY